MIDQSFNPVRSGLNKRANDTLGIPARYRKLSLENFEGNAAEVAEARAALSQAGGVLISGPCGVGKTHLAVGLLLDWFADALTQNSRAQGLFVAAADLASEIASLGRNGEGRFLRKYDDFDCLLLDDLGAELSTERSRHALGALIDLRYRRMRRTLITTNLSLQDLSELYDDRMASRIAGMCSLLRLEGGDRRIQRPRSEQRLTAVGDTRSG